MSSMLGFSRLTAGKFGGSMFLPQVVMGQQQWLLCLFQDPQTLTLRSGMISYILLKIQRAFVGDSMEGAAHVIFTGISAVITICIMLVISSNWFGLLMNGWAFNVYLCWDEIKYQSQCQSVSSDMIKLPNISSEKPPHFTVSMTPLSPQANAKDTESQSTGEVSIDTDDSVHCKCMYTFDLLLTWYFFLSSIESYVKWRESLQRTSKMP